MEKDLLSDFIQQLIDMPRSKASLIAELFSPVEISKDQILLEEGAISTQSYFLAQGVMRAYVLDPNGQEVTTRMFFGPIFANDFLSFFKGEPARESYQVLTKAEIWAINYPDAQHSFHHLPEFRELGRMMLTMNYVHLHDRMLSSIQQTAEQRYLDLLTAHPEVLQDIPLKVIASYLDITDSSLSRIRRELKNRNS